MLIVVLVGCLTIMFIAAAVRRAARLIDPDVLSDVMDGARQAGPLRESRLPANLMG